MRGVIEIVVRAGPRWNGGKGIAIGIHGVQIDAAAVNDNAPRRARVQRVNAIHPRLPCAAGNGLALIVHVHVSLRHRLPPVAVMVLGPIAQSP